MCCNAGDKSHISVDVQREKDDGTVVSKHSLQSGSGQTALRMSDIEASPVADRAGPRAAASSGAALPAKARPQV